MKHYLSTFAGSAICGGFAFGIWPELWKTYGLMGGWLAIGSAGIAWGIVRFQGDFTQFFLAAPTLLCCLIGGALAGITIWIMRSCGNRLSKEEDAV